MKMLSFACSGQCGEMKYIFIFYLNYLHNTSTSMGMRKRYKHNGCSLHSVAICKAHQIKSCAKTREMLLHFNRDDWHTTQRSDLNNSLRMFQNWILPVRISSMMNLNSWPYKGSQNILLNACAWSLISTKGLKRLLVCCFVFGDLRLNNSWCFASKYTMAIKSMRLILQLWFDMLRNCFTFFSADLRFVLLLLLIMLLVLFLEVCWSCDWEIWIIHPKFVEKNWWYIFHVLLILIDTWVHLQNKNV